MGLDNDELLNELYEGELSNIPSIFRFNKEKYKRVLIVIGVLFIIMIVFISALAKISSDEVYEFITSESKSHLGPYKDLFNIGVVVTAILIAIFSVWIIISKYMDQKAFKKASDFARRMRTAERDKVTDKINEYKRDNHIY